MSVPTFSELDSGRFGKKIYRVLVHDAAGARAAAEFCRRERVDMLIARCPVDALPAAQALEHAGLFLTDTLVYFTGKTSRFTGAPAGVRPFAAADLAALEAVARAGFTGYVGHYHADPRLDAAAATEGYVERFRISTGLPNFSVFVADFAGEPAGFLTLNLGEEPANIELNAVARAAQGRGLYDTLVKAAGHAARAAGREQITVSTQINNFAPQRVWARNGLEPHRAFYTFHGWFDE